MIVLYMIKYRREGDIIRQKRIWYPGATYHAMARGIRRMVIFQDDTDYQVFLLLLKKMMILAARRIRETGLLLSEYPPGTEPSNYTFPQRNRLIASWSDRLIVIAAGRGSGAMITASCADKYGRKVSFY